MILTFKVCSVKIIFETQIVKDFLCISGNNLVGSFSGNDSPKQSQTSASTTSHNNTNNKYTNHTNENGQLNSKTNTNNNNNNTNSNTSKNNNATTNNSIENNGIHHKSSSSISSTTPHQVTSSAILTKANINKSNIISKLNRNYDNDNEDTATISSSCTKKKVITLNDELVDLKIQLPDKTTVTLSNIKQNANADEVYTNLIEFLDLDTAANLAAYFYLFEIIDQTFERKLRPHEQPSLINIQNYSNKCATCICMRKWYFNLKVETILAKNPLTLKYLFYQVSNFFFF